MNKHAAHKLFFGLLSAGVSIEEAKEFARACVESITEFSNAYPHTSKLPVFQQFCESVDAIKGTVRKFSELAVAKQNKKASAFAAQLSGAIVRLSEDFSPELWETLCECADHADHVLDGITALDEAKGTPLSDLKPTLGVLNLGKLGRTAVFNSEKYVTEMQNRHEKFVKALEREFKCEADRWEPLCEGVIVYFDPENTEKVTKAVESINAMVKNCLQEHDYILVRKGIIGDGPHSEFPKETSKWMFIYCPNNPLGEA